MIDTTTKRRALCAMVGAACLAILATGSWLRPAAAGHGTHEQLGLSACPWPANFDLPCATCGMTTAVSQAAGGRLPAAFVTQPAGALFALALAGVACGGIHGAAFGSRVDRIANGVFTTRAVWASLGIMLAAWAYKAATWTA